MTNLLEETNQRLKAVEKTPSDVLWVGNGEYVISWDGFVKIADVEYDSGYGAQEIASDLVVVGKDWWLERDEYDGSEGWSYKTIPQKNKNTKPIHRVTKIDGMWNSLEDLNKLEESKTEKLKL